MGKKTTPAHGCSEAVLRVVDLLYEAALDEGQWPQVLETIGGILQAQSGSLVVLDLERNKCGFHKYFNFNDSHLKLYDDYYLSISPYRNFMENFPVDGWIVASQLYTNTEITRTEYHNDFERPEGYRDHMGAMLKRDRLRPCFLDLQRPIRLGPYTPEQIATFKRLIPHVRRALQVSHRMWELRNREEPATVILERLDLGVILIDEDEKLCYANPRAEEILRAEAGLRKQNGRLAAELHVETGALAKLIHEAVLTGKGLAMYSGGWLGLSRTSHDQPLGVLVSPLPLRRHGMGISGGRACAVLLVSMPEQVSPPLENVLRVLYRLTPAEERLTKALVEGRDLKEIAETFQISRETARVQLKSVFQKTGTRRQSDLVRLTLNLPSVRLPDTQTE